MEKADILEMTVKYLKSVQEKPQQTGGMLCRGHFISC